MGPLAATSPMVPLGRTSRAVLVDDLQLGRMRRLAAGFEAAGIWPVEGGVARRQQGQNGRRLGHAVGMDELAIRENLKRLAQHALGHRRAAVVDVFEAREIEIAHIGVIDQHVEHGGHIDVVRDLLPLHGLQAVGGIEARHEDVAPAAGRDAEVLGAVGKMEHRAGMNVGRVLVVIHPGMTFIAFHTSCCG